MRISNSIAKTQRIIFTDQLTERIEILAEKMLLEPYVFDFEEEYDEDEEDLDEEESVNPEVDDFEEEDEGIDDEEE
jgi:hypothetical protein